MLNAVTWKRVRRHPDHATFLARTARSFGATETEVVRRGIALVAEASQVSRDHCAWRREQRFSEQRQRMPTLPGKRTWCRADLYR